MEILGKNINNNTNSEHDTGMQVSNGKDEYLNDCLKLKNSGDHGEEIENNTDKCESNSTFYQNNSTKETENASLSETRALSDKVLMNTPGMDSINSTNYSELQNSPEKVAQRGNSEEKSNCESTVVISNNSLTNEKDANEMDCGFKTVSVAETQTCDLPELPVKLNTNEYRNESDSDDDDESTSSSDTSSDSDFVQMTIERSAPKKLPAVKTKGELGLNDLPPIEDLVISVDEEEMTAIGKIHAVVETLVVIHAFKDSKPLDLDSVLFLSHDKPLGRVFDVFGQVVEPYYCVRFNSEEDIKQKNVEIGADVFFAPEKNDITTYVFVDDLQRQKGSDASWKFNNEPPEEHLDFSDDEAERAARRKRTIKNRNRQFNDNSSVPSKKILSTGDFFPQTDSQELCASPPRNNRQPYFQKHNRFSAHRFPPTSTSNFQRNSPQLQRHKPFSTCSFPPTSTNSNIHFHPPQAQRHNPFSAYPFSQLSPTPSTDSNIQFHSSHVQRHNPFSSAHLPPPLSPTPSICSVLSTSVRVQNSQRFSTPNQPRLPYSSPRRPFLQQSAIERPPTLYTTYQQPPVFGQVALLSPMPSPLPSPSPLQSSIFNAPTLIPASHSSPLPTQNYFNQRLISTPSPVSQSQHALHDPWLPNRSPDTFHTPPNHPITVQIPNQTNMINMPNTLQSNNVHLYPFANNSNNFPDDNTQRIRRFY